MEIRGIGEVVTGPDTSYPLCPEMEIRGIGEVVTGPYMRHPLLI